MKPKLPALLSAVALSALTAIACTKTDSVTAAEAQNHGGSPSVEASTSVPAEKAGPASKGKAKRPLHERARVWLT